jgi:group I intron endonuclease
MQKQERLKSNSGVYKIYNLKNEKCYIGSSKNVSLRCDNHKQNLKNNKHSNKHLQASYNKYGKETFIFLAIEYCDNFLEREQYWMDLLDANNNKKGYNKRIKVDSNSGRKGYKMSDEFKQKMRLIGLKRRDVVAKWASEFHKGKIISEETRKKMSISQKNRKVSLETRLKISQKLTKKIKNLESDFIWNNVKECALDLKVSEATIKNWIKGKHKSKYKLIYLEK